MLHNCIFLLNAGHETTTNLIGNGLVALAGNLTQKGRLIENPDLIKPAVEEILRFESSNQLGNRMTTEHVELGGITLPAGTPLTLCIGAANRDPAQFADPENLTSAAAPTGISPSARRASVRRHGAGAPRRRDRYFALSGAVSRLHAERRADPRAAAYASADFSVCRVR